MSATPKLDVMMDIQRWAQEKWKRDKEFEVDMDSNFKKYFVTFPYPYMNGFIHLGHAFTLTKCEFTTAFYRLKGRKCLFPLAFHCTGMPIKASADKIRREMDQFGYPPCFPAAETRTSQKPIQKLDRSKKSKAIAKAGNCKYQWQIMRQMGFSECEILQFADPLHWLYYFPDHCRADLEYAGLKIDWRRSFITTDKNAWYDRFVRWQMRRLKQLGRIKFGDRYTIFSPLDDQPCMDHDRSSGEGVCPSEYVLIKMKLEKDLYLLAATVRPETIEEGITNCWVNPDIEYSEFISALDVKERYVSSLRAARNMAYQGIIEFTKTPEGRVPIILKRFKGTELVGKMVRVGDGRSVPVLPLKTVLATKGTAIVASVPSDSPEDFMALKELKTSDMPTPIPIIEIPGAYGNLAAKHVCEKLKIESIVHQKDLLQLAKEEVYTRGFNEGVMIVGEFKGKKVCEVRPLARLSMLHRKLAIVYSEPEQEVRSRSGDDCVVALCAQWYVDYGDPDWKRIALDACDNVETYSQEAKNNLRSTIEQLHEHACSRSYGLGSKLPWDEQYLVESLTDSTIYMAFYTIAHLLEQLGPAEKMSEDETDRIFNDVFGDTADCEMSPLEKQMKQEFNYWYPLDLRCTGKDLLQNHIPYFIYTHCALFPKTKWPRSVNANGLLQLNAAKMSKSTGNFLTLRQCIDKYSADATRLVLADAGDSIEDANFMEEQAASVMLRLFSFVQWAGELLDDGIIEESHKQVNTFFERVFFERINQCVFNTELAIVSMQFKEAVKHAFFSMLIARDEYVESCGDSGRHSTNRALLIYFLKTEIRLLSIFCPHVCEHIHCRLIGSKTSILNESWPQSRMPIETGLLDASEHLTKTIAEIRRRLKTSKPPTHLQIGIRSTYPEWQQRVIEILRKEIAESKNIDNRILFEIFSKETKITKAAGKKLMPFVQMMKERLVQNKEASSTIQSFDELHLFNDKCVIDYMKRSLGNLIEINVTEDDSALPYKPNYRLFRTQSIHLNLSNPEIGSGLVEVREFEIFDGEPVMNVSQRLEKRVKRSGICLAIQDQIKHRQSMQEPLICCRRLHLQSKFKLNDDDDKEESVSIDEFMIDKRSHALVYLTTTTSTQMINKH